MKTFKRLLWISNAAFISLFVLLAFHNRPAIDDFHFINNIQAYGLWYGTYHEYIEWSTRWVSVFLNHFFIQFYRFKYIVGLTNILGLLLLFVGIYALLKKMLKRTFKVIRLPLFAWAIFVGSGLFYCSISVGETWLWHCASYTYLWSITALFLGISSLISIKDNFWNYPLLFVCFAYIGGSSAPLALMVLLFLTIGLFMPSWLIPRMMRIAPYWKARLILGIVACGISLFVLYMGEGNQLRESFFKAPNLKEAIGLNVIICGKLLLLKFSKKGLFLLAFTLPWYFLGFGLKNTIILMDRKWTYWPLLFLGTIITIYLHQLPITYKMHDLGPDRATMPITLYLYFSLSWFFFYWGCKHEKSVILRGIRLLPGLLAVYSILLITKQWPVLHAYAENYDQRIQYINTLTEDEKSKDVALSPLGPSGMLHSGEISQDPSHWKNHHFKKTFNLTGNVSVRFAEN